MLRQWTTATAISRLSTRGSKVMESVVVLMIKREKKIKKRRDKGGVTGKHRLLVVPLTRKRSSGGFLSSVRRLLKKRKSSELKRLSPHPRLSPRTPLQQRLRMNSISEVVLKSSAPTTSQCKETMSMTLILGRTSFSPKPLKKLMANSISTSMAVELLPKKRRSHRVVEVVVWTLWISLEEST